MSRLPPLLSEIIFCFEIIPQSPPNQVRSIVLRISELKYIFVNLFIYSNSSNLNGNTEITLTDIVLKSHSFARK